MVEVLQTVVQEGLFPGNQKDRELWQYRQAFAAVEREGLMAVPNRRRVFYIPVSLKEKDLQSVDCPREDIRKVCGGSPRLAVIKESVDPGGCRDYNCQKCFP